MATRLYPPAIAGTLPAFCGTETLSVPFSMNRAVSATEVLGFSLKIKTVSGEWKGTLEHRYEGDLKKEAKRIEWAKGVVDSAAVPFSLKDKGIEFNVGQYYKVQLAYIGLDGMIGIYSTVGVIKYTSTPDVYIENLEFGHINQHNYSYVGIYSQAPKKTADGTLMRDSTEKLYSSYFTITDEDGNIIIQTKEKLHKSFEDEVSYQSAEEIVVSQDLDVNRSYYIQFFTTSLNGLTYPSQKYRIMQRRSISPDVALNLVATLDYDNGFISMKMDTKEPVISGLFLVSRAASNNGYKWEEFKRFDLQSMLPEKWSLMDCTIEQGVTYKYSIQQYNENGIYSDRIVSNGVFADFEDSFLYDGEKQLKIRFNPKVSSFKANVLESKIDTIGSEHPYILRNGNVYYRDFPISGLISYQMDDTELFCKREELGLSETTTNLTSENLVAERLFKLKVLEWLTNGKAKLFRSPGEGNYIVRLMNTSMSPNDTLGRMLHTFSSTAYEIAKFTMQNLEYYGLVDARENISVQTRWATVDLLNYYRENSAVIGNQDLVTLNTRDFYKVEFRDMIPGTMIYLDEEKIAIGATGAYIAEAMNNIPFKTIQIAPQDMAQGQVTYSYKAKATNVFGTIDKILIEDVPCWQWVGQYPSSPSLRYTNALAAVREYNKSHPDEIYTDSHSVYQYRAWGLENLLSEIENCKVEVLHIAQARFIKRPMVDVFINNVENQIHNLMATGGQVTGDLESGHLIGMEDDTVYIHGDFNHESLVFYTDSDCTKRIEWNEFDPYCLYNIRFGRVAYEYLAREGYIIDRISSILAPATGFFYDPISDTISRMEDDMYEVYVGDDHFSIKDTENATVKNISDYSRNIRTSVGVITELSFSKQIAVYTFEAEQPVSGLYTDYENALKNFRNAMVTNLEQNTAIYNENLRMLKVRVNSHYDDFILALNKEIADYKEANGIV
jgi:hypothetical protein